MAQQVEQADCDSSKAALVEQAAKDYAIPKAVAVERAVRNSATAEENCLWDRYRRMTELAASLALELEEFVPRLGHLQEYSTATIKHMRAQCRTAMSSNNEIVEARLNRDPNIRWNGPRFCTRLPHDLPDFYLTIRRLREEQQ